MYSPSQKGAWNSFMRMHVGRVLMCSIVVRRTELLNICNHWIQASQGHPEVRSRTAGRPVLASFNLLLLLLSPRCGYLFLCTELRCDGDPFQLIDRSPGHVDFILDAFAFTKRCMEFFHVHACGTGTDVQHSRARHGVADDL